MGLLAIRLWSGTLDNAEFMNLFNSMIGNCGRGSEISIGKFSEHNLRKMHGDNMVPYDNLE